MGKINFKPILKYKDLFNKRKQKVRYTLSLYVPPMFLTGLAGITQHSSADINTALHC